MNLPTIAFLWLEGPLSFLDQLCIKSFVDAGHDVLLYHYGPVQNVPDGVTMADAARILPRADVLTHQRTGSPALHSDLFRYHLLAAEPGIIWADTDAYCLRPFETETGHFHGWESDSHVNGGVLGLPPDSATLRALLDFTGDEYAIPTWYGEDYARELEVKKAAGSPVHASEQPWGVWGPHALTHFLHETGEIRFSLPRDALYPFSFRDRRLMLRRNFDTTGYITDNTRSVHFYGRRMRKRLVEKEGGVPHPKSLIGRLLVKHGVDPAKAPLPGMTTAAPPVATTAAEAATQAAETVSRPAYRGLANLTDLADGHGSDKGSAKHRYTELYQMLFLPFRDRKINFLEMGLLIGGPEHGIDKDRATNDLPSIRMWLDFFRKATIHGLDVSDFSWFEHDRFRFTRCDMDRRENIRAAAADLPDMHIVIDDASHASHHQQFGFLELWDRLAPGGLYIIEDLRWQPKSMEREDFTKTGDLFYGFQTDRRFSHADPALDAEFNALAPEISGCFVFQAGYNRRKRNQVAVIHKR